MRALITGISGFVGGHLAEHLVSEGDFVVGLSRSGRRPPELNKLTAKFERFDLVEQGESELVELLARKQPEVVYHLAAQANPHASESDPRGTWAVNLGGAMNLLEAVKASGLKPRVVIVSSGVCYGNPAPEFLPVNESCPLRPINAYASSKAAVDLLGIEHHLARGADVVIVRPFNHAGPRQTPNYVLSGFAKQTAELEAEQGGSIKVGDLRVVRDFTDVRDVVRAYRLLAVRGKPGEIYNLGTGRELMLTKALEYLQTLAEAPIEVVVDPDRLRAVDQRKLIADATKLRETVGWAPLFTIEETLRDMLDYWRAKTPKVALSH